MNAKVNDLRFFAARILYSEMYLFCVEIVCRLVRSGRIIIGLLHHAYSVLQSSRKNTRLVCDSPIIYTRSMYGRAAHRNTADEHRDSVCALKQ